MTLPLLLRSPRFVEWGIRIDTAPAWWWLAAQLAAVAATWLGASQGLPGAVALLMVAAVLWPRRGQLRAAPRLGWMALALAATLLSTLALSPWAGLLALVAALLAFMPVPSLPYRLTGRTRPQVLGNSFLNRVVCKSLFALTMLVCLAWALWKF